MQESVLLYINSVVQYPVYSRVYTQQAFLGDENFLEINFKPNPARSYVYIYLLTLNVTVSNLFDAAANVTYQILTIGNEVMDAGSMSGFGGDNVAYAKIVPVHQLFETRLVLKGQGLVDQENMSFVAYYQLIYNDKKTWQHIQKKYK